MIKIFMGLKGTGKTKTLIEKVNAAAAEDHGIVVCIEKGDKLRYDVSHKARLISSDEFGICDYDMFYGFICGLLACNYDITAIYVDSITKICGTDDIAQLEQFVRELEKLNPSILVYLTVSADEKLATEEIRKYF